MDKDKNVHKESEDDYDEEEFVDDDDDDEDHNDYDDDDDDDEYIDDHEEDCDDNDDNDSRNTNKSVLDGILSIDDEFKLHYKGNKINLISTEPLVFNILDANAKPLQLEQQEQQQSSSLDNNNNNNLYSFIMDGPCDIVVDSTNSTSSSSPAKFHATQRKIQVTWVEQNDDTNLETKTSSFAKGRLKGDDDDDDEDHDEPKKSSAQKQSTKTYQLYGKEIQSSETKRTKLLEFKGGYHPVVDFTNSSSVPLISQVRLIEATKNKVVVANSPTTTTTTTTVAVAAPRPTSNDSDNDDDDYGDTGVEYDELIALHEDADLPVESVRKRLRNSQNDDDDDRDGTPKKLKLAPSSRQNDEDDDIDDDDDDDIGF